jgi:hypothetical protein
MFCLKTCGLATLLFFFIMPTAGNESPGATSAVKGVEVSVRSLSRHADRWEIEIEARNDSEDAVYVLTEPKLANGKPSPYIDVDQNDERTLSVSAKFFKGPGYFLYINATSLKLRGLDPHTSYAEKYLLLLPLRSTIPPYGNSQAYRGKLIDLSKIDTVIASVGVLPDDEGIRAIANRQPLKHFPDAFGVGESNGHEILASGKFKGKPLIEAETVISVSYKL